MSFSSMEFQSKNHDPNTIFSKQNNNVLEKKIANNIFLIKSDLNLEDNIDYEGDLLIDGLVLAYNLNGSSNYKSKTRSKYFELNLNSNDSHIFLSKRDNIKVSISKGNTKSMSIIMKKDFIIDNMPNSSLKDAIINSLDKNIPNKLITKRKIDIQLQLLLNSIYYNPFEGALDNLFIQSKILECIFLEFKDLVEINPFKTNNVKLDSKDIEAIKKAKDILIKNLQNPPSIVELAKKVRINEFKLKIGFKKVFNDTPYNILLDYKLELAQKLLKNSDMNIEEIGKYIGYKHSPNFTKAFIKKYKVRPMDLMKKRKYYY